MVRDDLREAARVAFRKYLGREPESETTVDQFAALGSVAAIENAIAGSAEAAARKGVDLNAWFITYFSMFDAEGTIRRHARPGLVPDPLHLTNFLGVKTEETFYPGLLDGKAGTVEAIPIPANWHADIAEWAAVLRAVDLARDTFTIAELGCGSGCWINNAGVAARSAGLDPKLIGVEGDEGHIAFARRACATNGFRPDQVTLHRGIAAGRAGFALFPRQDVSGVHWGLQPVFGASDAERREAAASGRFDELPMLPLADIVGDAVTLDLLHVDIQGGEADLVEQAADVLAARVAYLFIGTHSREIEGRIMAAMRKTTWRLEIERPAIVDLTADGPLTLVDGVQGWRNMVLRPA